MRMLAELGLDYLHDLVETLLRIRLVIFCTFLRKI